MSDNEPIRLEPFQQWFDARFRKPDGSQYGRRAQQKFIVKLHLPIIIEGWARLIDPAAGDRRVAEHAAHQEPRRGRGRPRAVRS